MSLRRVEHSPWWRRSGALAFTAGALSVLAVGVTLGAAAWLYRAIFRWALGR